MGALVATLSGDGSPRRQRRENGERTDNMTTTLQYACAMCVVELGPSNSDLKSRNQPVIAHKSRLGTVNLAHAKNSTVNILHHSPGTYLTKYVPQQIRVETINLKGTAHINHCRRSEKVLSRLANSLCSRWQHQMLGAPCLFFPHGNFNAQLFIRVRALGYGY